MKDKKNHIMIGIAAAILVTIAVTAAFYMQTAGKENRVQKDLELAAKYLDELDYEQAIAMYNKVLEIDENNIDALTGLSQAYLGKAEDETVAQEIRLEYFEMAVGYVESAQSYVGENIQVQESLPQICQAAGDFCMEIGETEKAEAYYKRADGQKLGNTDTAMQSRKENMQKTEETELGDDDYAEGGAYQEILERMLDAYRAGNIEVLCGMVHQPEYMKITDGMQGDESISIYCGEYDADGLRNGTGVAVYRIEGITTFYVGEWKDGKRDGQAFWSGNTCYWIGSWQDDLPNGRMKGAWYEDRLPGKLNEGEDILYFYSEGNVVDGLWDGEIIESNMYKGEQYQYSMRFDKGIVEIIDTDSEGDYLVGYDFDKNSFMVKEEEEINITLGVWGFAEKEGT